MQMDERNLLSQHKSDNNRRGDICLLTESAGASHPDDQDCPAIRQKYIQHKTGGAPPHLTSGTSVAND